MSIRLRLALSAIRSIGLVVLLSLVPLARAQASETMTATAHVKGSGIEASAPVGVIVDRFPTDAERDTLVRAANGAGSVVPLSNAVGK